ncbi:MAG: hypothetical protein NUV56_03495 [Candidatus Uhrbacteria bacterium]|nr:hypothetical protein [Candidatus Uhrbacteria bacterium]
MIYVESARSALFRHGLLIIVGVLFIMVAPVVLPTLTSILTVSGLIMLVGTCVLHNRTVNNLLEIEESASTWKLFHTAIVGYAKADDSATREHFVKVGILIIDQLEYAGNDAITYILTYSSHELRDEFIERCYHAVRPNLSNESGNGWRLIQYRMRSM